MNTGYSGKPLLVKLGIKPGQTVAFVDAPAHYRDLLGELPIGVEVADSLPAHGHADFVQFFATSQVVLEDRFPELKAALKKTGSLWISWPNSTAKGSAKLATDLTDNVVRDIGLANGLVDVKVVAVDETWSGIKFVYRLVDRQGLSRVVKDE